jgi:hypothetical protein
MADLPSGTVTFLSTDIQGSTALCERDRMAMHEAVSQRLSLLRDMILSHSGVALDGRRRGKPPSRRRRRALTASGPCEEDISTD